MTDNKIQTAFTAGELSPALYGRVDMNKYHVGAAKLRNFIVDYRGGASNRTGTAFVGYAKNAEQRTRLVKFKFNAEQQYVLEFGPQYMRVIYRGGYVLEATKTIVNISNASPGQVFINAHGFADGDWVYFDVPAGMTQMNKRIGVVSGATVNDFFILDQHGNPIDTTAYTAFTAGECARIYTLVTPYAEADLFDLKFAGANDTVTITHKSYQQRELQRLADTNWQLVLIDFTSPVTVPFGLFVAVAASGAPTSNSSYSYRVSAVHDGQESYPSLEGTTYGANISSQAGSVNITWAALGAPVDYFNIYKCQLIETPLAGLQHGQRHGYLGSTSSLQFVDNNVSANFTKTPPKPYNPFAVLPITDFTVIGGGAGYDSTSTITVTDPTGTGFSGYLVVNGGVVRSVIIENGGQNYTAPVVVLGGPGGGAVITATTGNATGTWPAVAGYFESRKVFAASANFPQTLWATRPGLFKNMDKSFSTVDDDSYSFTLASTTVNTIRWMVPMPGGLVLFTDGGVWQLNGGQQGTAVTPSNVKATPQAYTGAANVEPIPINSDILFVQDKASIARSLRYNLYANIYTSQDLTVLSNHFFNTYRITEWTYAEEPYKIIWAVRDDGQVLALTYLAEQEVVAWTLCSTRGQVKSIACIQEGDEDAVYMLVQRTLNGQIEQVVERMASRRLKTPEDAWFMDCARATTLNYPAGTLYVEQASGESVLCRCTDPVFDVSMEGWHLRVGGGFGEVISYLDPTQVYVNFIRPITDVVPDVGNDVNVLPQIPVPAATGDWSCTVPVSTVNCLWHLEGETVRVIGDGSQQTDKVVTNGQITLEVPCSLALVGLPYVARLQSLPLDVGEPTVQGKRKKIAAVTIRMINTRSILVGEDFEHLYEVHESQETLGVADDLFSGDRREPIGGDWNVGGQICVEQPNPWPVTVLALIPEVVIGDDM